MGKISKTITISYGNYKLRGPLYLIDNLNGDYFDHQLEVLNRIIEKIKCNNEIIFFDVGANIGQTSLIFSQIQNSKTYAFEPVLESYELLTTNVKMNNINNIKTFSYGLYDKNMRTGMGTPKNLPKNKIIDRKSLGMKSIFSNSNEFTVELKKGDQIEIVNELSSLDLLKIDVEGAELSVLKGLKKTIETYSPIIIMEYSTFALNHSVGLIKDIPLFLKSLGYKYVIDITEIKHNHWNHSFTTIDSYDFPKTGAPDLIFSKSSL